jgi:hypothetical protein
MKKKILKIVMWVVIVIVVVLTFLWFLGTYGYDIQNHFRAERQEKAQAEIEKEKARILEAQKNDIYGGKTPEETLDLYITALKAGDIELASKYSEISLKNPYLQEKELDNLLRIISDKNKMVLVIKEAENIRNLGKKNIWSDSEVSFIYEFITKEEIRDVSIVSQQEIVTIIPAGTSLDVGNALQLNPYTKVWKIIQ